MHLFSLPLFVRIVLLSALFAGSISHSSAATRYVEKWGDDNNAPDCTKGSPCQSITAALDASAKNDRIVVGPGTYTQPTLIIDIPGLQLFSTLGRHATTIISETGRHAVRIAGSKVRIGRKGKGFTVTGAWRGGVYSAPVGFVPGQSGIHIDVEDGTGIKIEGNRFGGPRKADAVQDDPGRSGGALETQGFENFYGLRVNKGGHRIQIRNNIFQNNRYRGIFCEACTSALISNNRLVSNGSADQRNGPSRDFIDNGGIVIEKASDRLSILNNLISSHHSGSGAIYMWNRGGNIKIKDNVTTHTGGIYADPENWLQVSITNNISFFNRNGVKIETGFRSAPAIVKGNLISNTTDSSGVYIYQNQNPIVTHNTVISSAQEGFYFNQTGSPVSLFKFNASLLSEGLDLPGRPGQGGCGVSVVDPYSEPDFDLVGFFTYGNNSDDVCGPANYSLTGRPATKPPRLSIRRAAQTVGG